MQVNLKSKPKLPMFRYDAALLGKWAIAAMHCATAIEAFQLALRYAELSLTYFQFVLKASGNKAFFIFRELMDFGKCRKFLHECQLRAVYQSCTESVGGPIPLHEIRFAFPKPAYANVYTDIFGCPVSFNAEETMLVFDSSLLSLSLPKANPLTCKLYEKECEQLLQSLNALETTKDMVHRELICEHETFPTLAYVARRLHMSPRTLRRRLQAEASTFKGIAEDVRRIKALDLLKSTDQSLELIAEQLGYSDVPNFCHAFKRWTGRTPSSYR
ncbi:MAG: AraC family transcriptional regulator ligand-binding domain-containing protein [Deltaproteobacteria bacterium]|nr:AraC family transcriptional regulator ligand-binding domain-containing protein [Deltaproteobacteria bacterium]